MTEIKLSPRLLAIANQVPACGTIADVGCDHAQLAIWLSLNNRANKIIASDIRSGPLGRARTAVESAGVKNISLLMCDGLEDIPPQDAVIIAGMGGETIAGILERAEWTREKPCTLILQPMTTTPVLRRFLYENGYFIKHESYVQEGRRIYVILTAAQGKENIDEPSKLYVSEAASNDPLAVKYIQNVVKKLTKELKGKQASKSVDENEVSFYNNVIETLIKRGEQYANGF